jgi:hypothetical protein
MGALCAVRPTIFCLPLRARLRCRQSRRFGSRQADTDSVDESRRQVAMRALPAQMKSTHVWMSRIHPPADPKRRSCCGEKHSFERRRKHAHFSVHAASHLGRHQSDKE